MATHHLKIAAVIQKTHNNSMSIHNNPKQQEQHFLLLWVQQRERVRVLRGSGRNSNSWY